MKGVRRHGRGWQARASVRGVGRIFQSFPLDTPDEDMQAWRRTATAQLELQRRSEPVSAGTLAADARKYLKAVAALPDIKNRTYDIGLWVALFGTRRTATIKPHEIRAQRDKWLTIGPKRVYNRATRTWDEITAPLAASTVNHRLRALQNLYTVLDPNGDNPVARVPEADEPDAEDRSLPYDVIETILAAMPDRGSATKDTPRPTVSLSKTRLRVMAYTGLTPAALKQLTPADIDLDVPAVRVARRKKGKGAAGGWKPVPVDAIPALQAFMDANAFGPFSRDAVRQAWQRACARLQIPRVRVYDLRHAFASAMLEQTHDLKATQRLLNHADPRTTERYARRAIPAWLSAAVAKVRLRVI